MLIELCPMVLNGGIVKNPYPKIFHRLALIVPAWFPDYFCRTFKSNKAVDVWKVGSLRKTNKQTCNAICVCACVCVGRWGRNQVDFCQFVIHCWYICDVFATWLVFGYGYVLVECFWLTLNFFFYFLNMFLTNVSFIQQLLTIGFSRWLKSGIFLLYTFPVILIFAVILQYVPCV